MEELARSDFQDILSEKSKVLKRMCSVLPFVLKEGEKKHTCVYLFLQKETQET